MLRGVLVVRPTFGVFHQLPILALTYHTHDLGLVARNMRNVPLPYYITRHGNIREERGVQFRVFGDNPTDVVWCRTRGKREVGTFEDS